MTISYDVTGTLRAETKHHEPIVLVFDARGNGGGQSMPNDNRKSSGPDNGLHRDCYTENHYGDYRPTEQSNNIRANGASIGGGSEVLVVETLVFDEMQITSKINGNNPTWGGVCHTISSNAARTTVIIKMQNTTGTLSQGAHPGSYNGQDAYNDMLVVDDGGQRGEWTTESGDNVRSHKRAGCHARSASDFIRGGVKN